MKEPYPTLLDDVRLCTLCASQLPFQPNPILQLHPQARILIAGQAPGLKAHDSNKPFNDPSGVRLRGWMDIDETAFYNPELVAILPMGFCYPGKGPSGDLPPRPECAEHWRSNLLELLPNIQLTLVIGQYAQRWHLAQGNKENLTDIVRNWRAHWPEVLPLPHPSPRNNRWLKQNPWFEGKVLPVLRSRVFELISLEN
jgi:uracil-DNA glycosylase